MVDDYIRYLRDMSRKIAFRGGFDTCLSRRITGIQGNHPLYYELPNSLEQRNYKADDWIKSYALPAIKKDGNSGVYLGSGFLMGRPTIGNKVRTIASPLMFCPLNVSQDEETGSLEFEAVGNDIQLNLDLLSSLMNAERKEEDEDTPVPQGAYEVMVKECEKLIEEADWSNLDTLKSMCQRMTEVSEQIIEKLRGQRAGVSLFSRREWPGHNAANDAINRDSPCAHYAIGGLFLGPSPSQVTTYGSLVKLIAANERTGIGAQNRVLASLLESTLNGTVHENRVDSHARDQVDSEILSRIPMSLSDKQREAVCRAWSSDISYVQGPPGTGKSHTITAMLLAGVLMGKRVLLVSNKKAALDVVRQKLSKIIPEEYVFYAVRDDDGRRQQRAIIQAFIDKGTGGHVPATLNQLAERIRRVETEFQDLRRSVGQLEQELGAYLKSSKEAHDQCGVYLSKRDLYCRQYGRVVLTPDHLAAHRASNEDAELAASLREWHNRCLTESGQAPLLESLRARAFLSKCIHRMGMPRTPGVSDFNHANDYVDVIYAHAKYDELKVRIPPNIDSLRMRLADARKAMDAKSTQLIRLMLERRMIKGASEHRSSLQRLSSILHFRSPKRLKGLMEAGVREAIDACPLWAGEIKDLSTVLPFQSGMFDLVVVDEASQVNIPEIVPAFFRGTRFCVVGDERQLGLGAAGFFSINTSFERLTWQRHITGTSYDEAGGLGIIASKDSILDFIIKGHGAVTADKIMLNEHFRSKPLLAKFTSDEFYADGSSGGLRIMTQNGKSVEAPCFELRIVGGTRDLLSDYVENEISEALGIARAIADGGCLATAPLCETGLHDKPTVGIVSFMRDQKFQLDAYLEMPRFADLREKLDLFVGTPEEFQGNERDIVILTFGLGVGLERYSRQFFENKNRFNVATSRARHFTYAVIGACPRNAVLLRKYFASYGYTVPEGEAVSIEAHDPTVAGYRFPALSRSRLESEFERMVLEELELYSGGRSARGLPPISIHNQVEACGQKRLDFVLLNTVTKSCVAVEADGPSHYCSDGRTLTSAHIERCDILRRAGWKLIHIEHHAWYKNGWLRKEDQITEVQRRLHEALDSALDEA